MKWLGQLTEAETYDGAREILQQVTWKRLPRVSSSVDAKIKEQVKEIHADFKTAVENLRTGYFVHPLEELEAEMAYIYPSVKMLTELVNAFEQQFKAEGYEQLIEKKEWKQKKSFIRNLHIISYKNKKTQKQKNLNKLLENQTNGLEIIWICI